MICCYLSSSPLCEHFRLSHASEPLTGKDTTFCSFHTKKCVLRFINPLFGQNPLRFSTQFFHWELSHLPFHYIPSMDSNFYGNARASKWLRVILFHIKDLYQDRWNSLSLGHFFCRAHSAGAAEYTD